MTREERAKKRAAENLHYAVLTATIFGTAALTFVVHLAGCAFRGSHGFGGELLIPAAAVMMYHVVRSCEEVKRND